MTEKIIYFKVREHSWIAYLAAKVLRAKGGMAITIGNTIHLHKAKRKDLLGNMYWLVHELTHVWQFQHFGFLPFMGRYLWESLRKGYYNNKYEIAARANELRDIKKLGYRGFLLK